MAKQQYMDYGTIWNPSGNNKLPEVPVDTTKHGQVYYNTHNGEGLSLSFTDKAFISFTYGGRKIEDFNLIAVSVNDRLDRETPPEHEDYTTEYKMLHGQYYWGSHYTAREMDIMLATDGITQKELDDFKYWFRAGEIRELILSEHPNRAIMARISAAPKVSVVPFKRKKTITIGERSAIINVTEYRGNIELNFVMDEPFWYAVHDVLGHTEYDEDSGEVKIFDTWTDVNGLERSIFENKDALRIVEEDRIPTASMIQNLMMLANDLQVVPYNLRKYTVGTYEPDAPVVNNESGLGSDEQGNYTRDGAIVGPFYHKIYPDGMKVTTIDEQDCIVEYILNDNGNFEIPQYTNEADEEQTQNITTTFYYPVKKNSTIIFKSFKDENIFSRFSVIISKYTKSNGIYNHKTGENEILSSSSLRYQANSNEFIRITVRIKNSIFSADSVSITLSDNSVITIDKNNPITFFNLLLLNLFMFNTDEGKKISKKNTDGFSYFYSGTAPSYPIISFNVPIVFDENGYIISFNNEYTNNLQKVYNSLILLSAEKHELKITNPSIFNSYNKVINILHSSIDITVTELIKLLREEIGHIGVRNWIIGCINVYYNNHNQNITLSPSLMVTTEIKAALLTYMPYLFATFDDADITYQEELAAEVAITSIQLSLNWPTFRRLDALKQRFPLKDNIIRVEEFTNNTIDNLLLTPIFSVTTTQTESDGILYWRWQYSRGDGKWYLLFNEENVWDGVDTPTLTCYSLANFSISDNNPLYLRCIVSNNVSYTGTNSILAVQSINDRLLINCDNANINVNYKATANITWTIEGEFITTAQAIEGNESLYQPRLYYYNENQSLDWINITSINSLDDFVKQMQNFSFNISLNKATLSFTALENRDRELRDTKFKIRLYKVTANNSLDSNDYVESESPVLQIKRLEIENIALSVTANGVTNTYSQLPTTVLNYLGNTQITLILSGITNFNTSNSLWQYREYQENNIQTWTSLKRNNSIFGLKYTTNNNIIQLTGSFYVGDPSSLSLPTYEFRFHSAAYGLILNNEIFRIHQLTNQQLNSDIVDEELPTYANNNRYEISYNVIEIQMYTNSESTILASYPSQNALNTLPTNSVINCSYQWQKTSTLDDQEKPTNWIDIDNATNKQYTIQESNLSSNVTFYYRCMITLARIYKKDDFTVQSSDILYNYVLNQCITCHIYLLPEITGVSGGLLGATYFSLLHLLLLNNGDIQYMDNNPVYNILLQCNVNNLLGIKEDSIVWYKINSNGTGTRTVYTDLSQSILITANMLSQGQLIGSYYCTFSDYLNQPYSSRDNPLIISYQVEESRIRLITLSNDYILSGDSLSWNWPTMNYVYTTAMNITLTSEVISSAITYTTGKWEYSGIFPPLNISSYSNYSNYTEYNQLLSLYQEQLASFQTICSLPKDLWNTYRQIQFMLQYVNTNSSSDYGCELKVLYNGSQIQPDANNLYTIERINSLTAINIQAKLYSNITWSTDIGFRTSSGASMTVTQKYNSTKWPETKGQFTITLSDLKGIPQTSSVLTNQLLNMSPLSLKLSPNNSVMADNLITSMPMLVTTNTEEIITPHLLQLNNMYNFNINNNTGEYFMTVKYNYITQPNGLLTNEISSGTFDSSPNNICYFSNLRQNEAMIESVESVGDMILSNNLVFELQNHFDLNNTIQSWSEDDKTLSHKLTYDGDIPLLNFELTYKNYYL